MNAANRENSRLSVWLSLWREMDMFTGLMAGSGTAPESVGSAVRKETGCRQPTREMLNNRGYHFFNIVSEL